MTNITRSLSPSPKRGRAITKETDLELKLKQIWIDINYTEINPSFTTPSHICRVLKTPHIKLNMNSFYLQKTLKKICTEENGYKILTLNNIRPNVYYVRFNKPYYTFEEYEIELILNPLESKKETIDEKELELIDIEEHIDQLNIHEYCVLNPIHYIERSNHLCIVELCPEKHLITEYSHTEPVYICKKSGKIHFCGEKCTELIKSKETSSICKLTGLCITGTERVPVKPILSLPFIHNPLQTSYSHNFITGDEEDNRFFNVEPRKMYIKLRDKKSYYDYTYNEISKSFSKEREDYERKMNVQRIERKKQIVKYNYQQTTTSEQSFSRQNSFELLQSLQSFDLKKSTFVEMKLPDDEKKIIISRLSWKCLKLWYNIVQNTPLGQENPNLFYYPFFIMSALQLLNEGFSYVNRAGQEIPLIIQEPILTIYPPWIPIHSNKKHNPFQAHKNTFANIKKAFNDALEKHVSLELLDLTNIENFDNEDVFISFSNKYMKSKKQT